MIFTVVYFLISIILLPELGMEQHWHFGLFVCFPNRSRVGDGMLGDWHIPPGSAVLSVKVWGGRRKWSWEWNPISLVVMGHWWQMGLFTHLSLFLTKRPVSLQLFTYTKPSQPMEKGEKDRATTRTSIPSLPCLVWWGLCIIAGFAGVWHFSQSRDG